jgi:hypothetical protein
LIFTVAQAALCTILDIPQDQFGVWENLDIELVDKLKKHITEEYGFRQITKTKSAKKLPDNHDIFRISEDGFIVITKQIYGEHAGEWQVKASKPVTPILEDFLGPENAPPICF